MINTRVLLYALILSLITLNPLFAATKNIEINADTFELDANKNIVKAIGNVVVQQKDVTIYGDRGNYNQNMQTIKIYDNILIKRGAMTLSCETVIANGKDNHIDASGAVTFFFNKITGKSKRAQYDIDEGIITLSGKPQARQSRDFITGERIIIDLNRNKITTQGKAKAILSTENLGN